MARSRSVGSVEHEEATSFRLAPIRVLLAEDMKLLRTALTRYLDEEDGIEVVANLRCDGQVVPVALSLRPDIAVVSANPPENNGLATVRRLREQVPACKIIALSMKRPATLLEQFLDAEVAGLIDKDAPATRLPQVIREIAAGGEAIDPSLRLAALSAQSNPFTPRELHVLQLVAEGANGPDIARQLFLSPGTVRNYLANAMSKVGARTRIDAIRIATELGWL